MQIIGLTGGIACGKSKATEIFRNNNIPVIDCDAIVHDQQNNNPILKRKLQSMFPNAFDGDMLNRKKLSNLVMKNQHILDKVSDITMPFIEQEILSLIKKYKDENKKIIVIDAPLLFEKEIDRLCNSTICIYIDESTQKKRFLNREGMTEEKWELFQKNQITLSEKKEKATYNFISDSEENLSNQIQTLIKASCHTDENENNPQIGFYAGSFDPLTKGHWNLICDAINRCSKVYVGVGINPNKKSLFSADERVQVINDTISDFKNSYEHRNITGKQFSKVEENAYKKLLTNPNIIEAISYQGLTIDAALRTGANVLLRGERNSVDHDYEQALTAMNQALMQVRNVELGSITLTPFNAQALSHISSSSAKALAQIGEFIAAEEYIFPTAHTKMMEKLLFPIFEKASKAIGISNDKKIEKEYKNIVKSHSNREYHNLSHLAGCINYLNIYDAINSKIENKHHIEIAIFYHDIVQGKDNDIDDSKNAMMEYLKDAPQICKDEIASLIDATNHTDKTKTNFTENQKIMADIDLSILGSETRYPNYAASIRDEYKQYPDITFASGRVEVLGKIISSPFIYKSEFFQKMFEQKARENINKEIFHWQSKILTLAKAKER